MLNLAKNRWAVPLVVVGVLGAAVVSGRTARVRRVRVVETTDTHVDVALDYSGGSRPQYVIVDVHSASGKGSATVEGEADVVRVLLSGPLGPSPTVELTASSRVLGRLQTQRAVFRV